MFDKIINNWKRKKLTNEKFAFLFDEDESDEVVVFDCETTGLNPNKDEIISIGAVKVKGNKILTHQALHLFIKQKAPINPKSITIHQIRHCDLDKAIEIEDAIEQFLYFIGSRKLVGYYLEFDVAMVDKYTKPMIGVKLPNRQEEVSALYYDKKIRETPQGNIDLSFETIIKDLKLPKLPAHDALNDAVMTGMIYLKLRR